MVRIISVYFFFSLFFLIFAYSPSFAASSDTTDIQHYMTKYGFFQPTSPAVIAPDVRARLAAMKPFAIAATRQYNARYHVEVEPELLLWWSYSEGITAHVNYSNCANESPLTGSYFTDIRNCDVPSFWQLGPFGIQFKFLAYFYGTTVDTTISPLKNAFLDMYGDPNNAVLVQHIGQAVLDFDKTQQTLPSCGGYSCTFPALTIDEILAGVRCGSSPCDGNAETQNNWWASVLSRDPGINAYIQSRGMWGFNRDQTIGWSGCYYAASCWQYESNKLGDILAVWNSLPSVCSDSLYCFQKTVTPTPAASLPFSSTNEDNFLVDFGALIAIGCIILALNLK